MKRMVEKMISGYGRALTVTRGEKTFSLTGFLQPVNANVERLALPQMGALGRESKERLVYIGPAEPALEPDDRLEADGAGYLVRSAQIVWAGNERLYCWAMCTKEGGADTWGLNG